MKKYRVFIVDIGCLPKGYGECTELVRWGISNIDGHFGSVFMKRPIAAHARILSEFVPDKPLSKQEIKRKILSSPRGIYFGALRNTLGNIASFLEWLEENMPEDAVCMLVGRFSKNGDGFLLIGGRDVIAVNLGTLDTVESVLRTAQALSGVGTIGREFSGHIIYSDDYLKENCAFE